jgi:hypothetical protein
MTDQLNGNGNGSRGGISIEGDPDLAGIVIGVHEAVDPLVEELARGQEGTAQLIEEQTQRSEAWHTHHEARSDNWRRRMDEMVTANRALNAENVRENAEFHARVLAALDRIAKALEARPLRP